MAKPFEVTDANFKQEVLESDTPVLVDFWAVWCGPCRMIAPIVEDLATEYDGKLKVGKLDADQNLNTTMSYGIMGIPTLLLFKQGKEVARVVGAMPKARILKQIQPHLS